MNAFRRRARSLPFVLFVALFSPGSVAAQAAAGTPTTGQAADPAALTQAALEGFEPWLLDAMNKWVVPGMAIGIVRNGQVVFARGFGLRDVESGAPVDENTLFAIGSSTKAFTAFDVGLLVDDGKLDFDAPVRRWLPGLRLADPVATEELSIKDMLSHRTGLPRHDAVWYNNAELTPDKLFERLEYFEPNKGFRETWQYNNLMFATAGHLVAQVSGKSWEDFTRARILEPLGMTSTTFSVTLSEAAPNHATPYREEEKKAKRIPFRNIDNIGPAGSINSNVTDMVKWVQLQLAGGSWQGKQIIQKATLVTMHTPQMVMAAPSDPMIGPSSYGLAWMLDTYRGHFRVRHGGNIDGFSALVALFPYDSVGVVALSNKNGSSVPEFVVRQIADRLFGLEPRDWSGEALERARKAEETQEENRPKPERVEGTNPSRPVADFVGDYEHPGYGIMAVRAVAGGTLEMEYNHIKAPLEHWHYDVFNALRNPDDPSLENTKIQFLSGFDGAVESLRVGIEPAVDPIVFTRTSDPKLSDPAYLARFPGTYELPDGIRITITLTGSTLTATPAGQPTHTLDPRRDDTFELVGLKGFRVRFTSEGGKVTGLALVQPNGTFRAKRVEG